MATKAEVVDVLESAIQSDLDSSNVEIDGSTITFTVEGEDETEEYVVIVKRTEG